MTGISDFLNLVSRRLCISISVVQVRSHEWIPTTKVSHHRLINCINLPKMNIIRYLKHSHHPSPDRTI